MYFTNSNNETEDKTLNLSEFIEIIKDNLDHNDNSICHFCQNQLYLTKGQQNLILDRIFNSQCHHTKNLNVVCRKCNFIRGNCSYKTFLMKSMNVRANYKYLK